MGLFKSKENIPSLPTSPSLPPLSSIKPEEPKKELPGLPSFPTDSKNENINQEIVKSAVADIPSSAGNEENLIISPSTKINKQSGRLAFPQRPQMESSIPEPPKQTIQKPQTEINIQKPQVPIVSPGTPFPENSIDKSNEPIFVRIDKFQSAQKNFEEIKNKLNKMEEVLKKIKNIKIREEEEIKGWTEDTQNLKSRLAEIDSDIFSQL